MFSMAHLLDLVKTEQAEALRLHVGTPPMMVVRGVRLAVESYPITAFDAEELLRSIATTRQMRELHERGTVQFVYRFQHATDFVVRAKVEDAYVQIDIH